MILPDAVQQAIVVGIFGIPATYTAYKLGLRKQTLGADAQLDQQLLAALAQREQTIKTQSEQIQTLSTSQLDISRQLGAAQASIEHLTKHQAERDDRERDLMRKLGSLESRISTYASCSGGSPCPFRHGGT